MKKFFSKRMKFIKFLLKIKTNKIKKIKTLYSLQVLRQLYFFDEYYRNMKRAFSSSLLNIRGKKLRGVLTIEAALTLPVFVITVLMLASFLMVSATEQNIMMSMENAGRKVSRDLYYFKEVKDVSDFTGLTNKVSSILKSNRLWISDKDKNKIKQIGMGAYAYLVFLKDITPEYLDNSNIVGKSLGINFSESVIDEDSGNVILTATYIYKVPFVDNRIFCIKGAKKFYTRSWSGRNISKESEEVYITKNGRVYHTSLDCRHLDIGIKALSIDKVENERNDYGRRYSKCKECARKKMQNNLVYITPTGERYHTIENCPGMNRTIIKVDKSNVQDLRACKDCGE